MLVQDVMRSPVVTVEPGVTLEEAYRLLLEKGIRHLPVMEEGRLVGPTFRTPFTPAGNIARPPGGAPRSRDGEPG